MSVLLIRSLSSAKHNHIVNVFKEGLSKSSKVPFNPWHLYFGEKGEEGGREGEGTTKKIKVHITKGPGFP